MEAKKMKFRVSDNEGVIEHYVNKVVGTMFDGGALTVTFGAVRATPPHVGEGAEKSGLPNPNVVVTARLSMSPSTAVELHQILTNMLSVLSGPGNKTAVN